MSFGILASCMNYWSNQSFTKQGEGRESCSYNF